jgi:hypothetical protein
MNAEMLDPQSGEGLLDVVLDYEGVKLERIEAPALANRLVENEEVEDIVASDEGADRDRVETPETLDQLPVLGVIEPFTCLFPALEDLGWDFAVIARDSMNIPSGRRRPARVVGYNSGSSQPTWRATSWALWTCTH